MPTPSVTVGVDGGDGYPMFVKPKQFKSGSKGYYVWGKVNVNGKRHQVICQLVEIGSKKNQD